jgi:RNA polymerase sigma-70 factor (ECF subfamily)
LQSRTDAELLAAIAAGDQAALGELYDRYASIALGLANRVTSDRGVAEEVVQDAFVSAWRRAGSYQPERGEPRTWLLSIVHHRAIDRIRGLGARARTQELDLTFAADTSGSADVWREAWAGLEREEIAAAVAKLPAEQREAIELAFFGGLSHTEIAERTGQPLGTIKGRVRLGLRRLRTVLQGYEHDDAAERADV